MKAPKFSDKPYRFRITHHSGGFVVYRRRTGPGILLTPRGPVPFEQALMIVRMLAEGDDVIYLKTNDGKLTVFDCKEFVEYWEGQILDLILDDDGIYTARDCLVVLGLIEG